AGAQEIEILPGIKDIQAVKQHLALRPLMGIKAIDTVKDAQQRGFSAARRTDEGRDLPIVEGYVDGFERFDVPIIEIEIPDEDLLDHFAGGIGGPAKDC